MYMIQGISNIVRNLYLVFFFKVVSFLKEIIDCKRGICFIQVFYNDRKRFFFNLYIKNCGILGCISVCIICVFLIILCMFLLIICFLIIGIFIFLQVFKKYFLKEFFLSEMRCLIFVLRFFKFMLLILFFILIFCLLFCFC